MAYERSFYAAEVASRPRISYTSGFFYHNGRLTRIVLRKDVISIGCSDVTIEAVRALVQKYDEKFAKPPDEYVLQE